MTDSRHPTRRRKSATSADTLIAQERRAEAVRLRLQGLSYRAIAEAMGLHPSTVHAHVEAALEETREEISECAETLRAMQLEEIRAAKAPLLRRAVENADHRAASGLVRLQEREAKLAGLDKASPDNSGVSMNIIASFPWDRPGWVDPNEIIDMEAQPEARGYLPADTSAPVQETLPGHDTDEAKA